VLAEVAVEIRLLAETSLADGTLVRLLLVVNVPDVPLEVGGDGEGPLAEVALVRLLAGVGAEVPGQVGGPGKGLAAIFAAVALRLDLRRPRRRRRRRRRRQYSFESLLY